MLLRMTVIKKIKRKTYQFIALLAALSSLFFVTSCFNYREIHKLIIVAGMAVDKDEATGEFQITFEVINVDTSKGEPSAVPLLVTSSGKSIFDAIRNAIQVSGKKLYFSHMKVVLFSRTVAKDSIVPVLDFITRDQEPRNDIFLLISEEKTAKEILEGKSATAPIVSTGIFNMVESSKSLSKTPYIKNFTVVNILGMNDGSSVYLPLVHLEKQGDEDYVNISGTALFRRDKLVETIGEEETKYMLFMQGEIKGGLIVFPYKGTTATLEIFESETKVEPPENAEQLNFKAEIATKVALGEIDASNMPIDAPALEHLEKAAGQFLKEQILATVNRIKNEYQLDVFHFGHALYDNRSQVWKSIYKKWDQLLPRLKVDLNVKIKIINTGQTIKSIKVGD